MLFYITLVLTTILCSLAVRLLLEQVNRQYTGDRFDKIGSIVIAFLLSAIFVLPAYDVMTNICTTSIDSNSTETQIEDKLINNSTDISYAYSNRTAIPIFSNISKYTLAVRGGNGENIRVDVDPETYNKFVPGQNVILVKSDRHLLTGEVVTSYTVDKLR